MNLLQRLLHPFYFGVLTDDMIRYYAEEKGMITPFEPGQIAKMQDGSKAISYGTSSVGYDIRLSRKFKVFNNRRGGVIDPLNFDASALLDEEEGDSCIIPPNSYILAHTCEEFNMPPNVKANCIGKSTYARAGLMVNVTPLEPGWIGHLTLELANMTPCPLRVYAHMGIAQLEFHKTPKPRHTYANRATGIGKYQHQGPEPVTARLK